MTTNLQWGPDEGEMEWAEAVAFAAAKGDGWRLPSVAELVAQFDYDEGEIKDDEWCWAASSDDTRPWLVNVLNGHSYDTYMVSYPNRVRCVRSVGGDR